MQFNVKKDLEGLRETKRDEQRQRYKRGRYNLQKKIGNIKRERNNKGGEANKET